MYYKVDAIEGKIAVLENDNLEQTLVPLALLPPDVKGGSVLTYDGEKYVENRDETTLQRKKLFALQQKLTKK